MVRGGTISHGFQASVGLLGAGIGGCLPRAARTVFAASVTRLEDASCASGLKS